MHAWLSNLLAPNYIDINASVILCSIGIHFSGFGDLNIAVSPVCSCDCENHAVSKVIL